jgi:hypothetical protein|tara:strand:+ start:3919 stop:4053 length:135 start_codon:yes stop_codon:yes gene_type:complete
MENVVMKSMLAAISDFFEALSRARIAADLTRSGRWEEAQAMYKD